MTTEVREDEAGSYYEVNVDGARAGLLVYEVRGSRVALMHTVVEPAFQGRGVASVLVRNALDDLRGKGRTVTVYCPYVISYLGKHPEYVDLVDPQEPGRFRLEA